jgi:hypothetical protein
VFYRDVFYDVGLILNVKFYGYDSLMDNIVTLNIIMLSKCIILML